jgi:hypothetical protein
LAINDSDYSAITVRRDGAKDAETIRVSDEMPLMSELRRFLNHIRGGPAPLSSLVEELQIMTVLEQIESAISRQ